MTKQNTMEYSQAGLGVLNGDLLSGNDMLDSLKSNLRFRVNSARDMFVGQSEMAPLQRRQEIIERQMDTFDLIIGGSDSPSSSSSSSGSSSGRVNSSSSRRSSESTSTSTSSGAPSMSDVNTGTRGRALDRGFEG